MINEIVEKFNLGQLDEAIQMANDGVRDQPTNLPLRLVLVQLLCFTGNWERVERIVKQIEALDSQQEHLALVNFINQLSIGEIQRKAVWTEGMVPEFVQPVDNVTQKLLWSWSCLRKGDHDGYFEALDFVLENSPEVSLHINDQTFEGFRDLDDQTCVVFEAHTLQGNYLWIPHSAVASMSISKPTRPVDYLWTSCRMRLHDGTDLILYLPGLYYHSFDSELAPALRLGRETRWVEDAGGAPIGQGRRIFTAGEEEFTLFDFDSASFSTDSQQGVG